MLDVMCETDFKILDVDDKFLTLKAKIIKFTDLFAKMIDSKSNHFTLTVGIDVYEIIFCNWKLWIDGNYHLGKYKYTGFVNSMLRSKEMEILSGNKSIKVLFDNLG